MISEENGQYLVGIAKEAVLNYLDKNMKIEVPEDCPDELKEKMGVFVTLNEDNMLRGCIGYPEAIESGIQATIDVAIAAACEDPRFPEVSLEEYPKLTFEVTVLTKPELMEVDDPLQYLDEIELGKDGLIIQKGYRRGLLLPQVATENEMGVQEFLEHTCMKAGISADSWLDASCDVYKFQGKVFRWLEMMIPTIPTPDELLDKGFRRGKKNADLMRSQKKIPKHLKGKRIEEARVVTACQVIKDKLKSIIDSIPIIEELPEFYQDYIDITVGVDDLKQALGGLNWAFGILTQLEKEYGGKIRNNPSDKASMFQKQAYGRIASVVNKIKNDLDFLDFAKQSLRNMPTVDFDAITIVIAGFPNVGKSTLLRQITGADPQVANYPFTTKGIQIGHTERRWQEIQIIDTPGLLDRPVLEMNDIELNALIALEHLADAILFIFDASETCGFTLESQFNLFVQIEKVFNEIPIIALFNKMDLIDGDEYTQQYIDAFEDSILISAMEGEGLDKINETIDKIQKISREQT